MTVPQEPAQPGLAAAPGAPPGRLHWEPGTATGVGSLPGTHVRDAVRMVVDALPDLPHVPELPDRGPGADMVGRTLATLPELAGEWGPGGWVLASRAGRDARRAAAWLREDLDTVEEELAGWDGLLKQQLCGPWTLAATVELRSGRKALSDAGATRDLGEAFAEAAAAHMADLAGRVPGARLVLQVDEPALPTVLGGRVPTPSGLSSVPAPQWSLVEQVLRAGVERVAAAGAVPIAHCCGAAPPIGLLVAAGFAALSLDAGVLVPADDDVLAEAVDRGAALVLGAAGATPAAVAAVVRERWRRTGRPVEEVVGVAVSPPCGLAGSTPDAAGAALETSRAAAVILRDDPEGSGG